MKQFMTYDFNIQHIALAIYLGAGVGDRLHHNRANHGLAFLLEGDKDYVFAGGNTVHLTKNNIIYLPKGSNYEVTDNQSGACFAINFDISEPIDFPPFAFPVKNTSAYLEHFKKSNALWTTKTTGHHMKCKAELYNIISLMQQEFALGYASSKHAGILYPAVTYIHDHYTEDNLSIGHLAGLCNISEPYFRRLFMRNFGVSPLKYINSLKITRAKELIASRVYTIGEVAFLSGYHDEAYFSREFKKAVGVAPSRLNV